MSDDVKEETPQEEQEKAPVLKLGDDLIAVIRELVQLTLLTGTNVVDHFRAIDCTIDSESGKLVPTEDYVDAYNSMVEQLVAQAEEEAAKEASEAHAEDAISHQDLEDGNFTAGIVQGVAGSGDGKKNLN